MSVEKLKGCFLHNSDHWSTPAKLYDRFISQDYIDPCPLHCEWNGLLIDHFNKKLFINPPYSDLKSWIDYTIKQYKNDCEIVLLIPARTDTSYFHKLIESCDCRIVFIRGRLKFGNSKLGAPFPSLLIYVKKGYSGYELLSSDGIN